MRRFITYLTLVLFTVHSVSLRAGPHDEGFASGGAANTTIRGFIDETSAATVVPGYTSTPSERSYYSTPNLSGPANARLTECLGATEPTCEATKSSIQSAITPRESVSPYDPSVTAARNIAKNPTGALDDLSQYYTSCTTVNGASPASTETKLCNRYTGLGNVRCSNKLNIDMQRDQSCTPGTWYGRAQVSGTGAVPMWVQVLCEPARTDGKLTFQVHAHGPLGACVPPQIVEVDMKTPSTSPVMAANLAPFWEGICWGGFAAFYWGQTCDSTISACSINWGFGFAGPVPGWTLAMAFDQPGDKLTSITSWDNQCAILEANAGQHTCTKVSGPTCIDGPSTKRLHGRDLTQACWDFQSTYSCSGAAALDECQPLAAQGCTQTASVCRQTVPGDPSLCGLYQDTYQCPTTAQTTTSVTNCDTQKFCVGESCFDTQSPNDTDFARSVTYLEAAREAGVYIDPATLRVFKGEPNSCRDKLLKNCCETDSAGAGMSNQSMLGTGSRFVYDVLFDSGNRQFITQGLSALVTGAGFSGSFTTYGVTVAVNGAAIPATSIVLYEGASLVLAFNPFTLIIAVVVMVVLAMMSCDEEEAILARKKGAALCHDIGTYCSSKSALLGCTEKRTTSCCFNSRLARIINEQGRAQIGKTWGFPEWPDCSGFTIAELQSLNFAAMDLSEFYASIVTKPPNIPGMQGAASSRIPTCYYGQGKC